MNPTVTILSDLILRDSAIEDNFPRASLSVQCSREKCSGELKLDGSGVPVVSILTALSSHPADLEIITIESVAARGLGPPAWIRRLTSTTA